MLLATFLEQIAICPKQPRSLLPLLHYYPWKPGKREEVMETIPIYWREKDVAPLASEEQGRLPIWHHMVMVGLTQQWEGEGKERFFKANGAGIGQAPFNFCI